MKTRITLLLLAFLVVPTQAHAAGSKPSRIERAEESFVGTWENTNEDTRGIVKLVIVLSDGKLTIQPWGKTHPQNTPFGSPDSLHVLSQLNDKAVLDEKLDAGTRAFAHHDARFADKYLGLRLAEDLIHLEAVTVFKDDSRRSNRHVSSTFRKIEPVKD